MTGGASNRTTSASPLSRLMTWSIRFAPSKSAGLGGFGPLLSSHRLSMPVSWSGNSVRSSSARLVRPGDMGRLKSSWSVGRRKSQSTRIVRRPLWAIVTARLATAVDLPSPGAGDVTTSVRMGWSRL